MQGQALDTLRWPATQAGGKRRRTDSYQPGPAKRPRRAGPPAHTKFRELLEPDVLQVRPSAYMPAGMERARCRSPCAQLQGGGRGCAARKLACSRPTSDCTMIESVLARQGATAAAAEAEAVLQRQLARKLGIKGAKRRALAAAGTAAAATQRGEPERGGAGARSKRLCLALGVLPFQGWNIALEPQVTLVTTRMVWGQASHRLACRAVRLCGCESA